MPINCRRVGLFDWTTIRKMSKTCTVVARLVENIGKPKERCQKVVRLVSGYLIG